MRWWIWLIIAGGIISAVIIVRRFIVKPSVIGDSQPDDSILGNLFNGFAKPMSQVDPDDIEALARMIASENPNDSQTIKIAIAWTAKNEASRRGISVYHLLAPDGNYGPQKGRYASTRNPGRPDDYDVATQVLSGAVSDPTYGAVQFDSPRGQRAALARSVSGYTKTPEQVAAERMSEGKIEVSLPGVSSDYMRFWRYA